MQLVCGNCQCVCDDDGGLTSDSVCPRCNARFVPMIDAPAPRCDTCPLWVASGREQIGSCRLSTVKVPGRADCLDRWFMPFTSYGSFCEQHPHYGPWALGEANRRLAKLKEQS